MFTATAMNQWHCVDIESGLKCHQDCELRSNCLVGVCIKVNEGAKLSVHSVFLKGQTGFKVDSPNDCTLGQARETRGGSPRLSFYCRSLYHFTCCLTGTSTNDLNYEKRNNKEVRCVQITLAKVVRH